MTKISSTELRQAEYGDFNLAAFRWDTAGLVRCIIRAREQVEPGFLGTSNTYKRWGLDDVSGDNEGVASLLRRVKLLVDVVDSHLVSMGGSGAVAPDDPLGEFKGLIGCLVNAWQLEQAIKNAERGKPIAWNKLAEWKTVPQIRDVLDQLPSPAAQGQRDAITALAVAESRRVKLFPRNHTFVALIDNVRIDSLTKAQHNVVKALLNAGAKGLSKSQLVQASGHSGAVGVLKRLANQEHWKDVISLPGRPGVGYRIH